MIRRNWFKMAIGGIVSLLGLSKVEAKEKKEPIGWVIRVHRYSLNGDGNCHYFPTNKLYDYVDPGKRYVPENFKKRTAEEETMYYMKAWNNPPEYWLERFPVYKD